ncbi:MAG: hypothetical protein M1812_004775 [Candelaria pacifica]|nr:MAG: hypothetical protein M1812_004775 [Candelaria pacifica]
MLASIRHHPQQLSLSALPDELVQHILYYVPPSSAAALERASKRFRDVSNEPLLWRYYCRVHFGYWDAEHDIWQKFASPVSSADWKQLYVRRGLVERATTHLIQGILSNQSGRIDKIQQIVELGYDVKDTLLRHTRTQDDAEDVLARRYYSGAVLGCVHRRMATKEWSKLRNGEPVNLERALIAFDMFTLHTRHGDFEETTSHLDRLARDVQLSYTTWDDLSTRAKALAIAAYLRSKNITGINSDDSYRDLQNNFIGIALQAEGHPSIPLISVAIFCSVAERLGLDARPCPFPWHIYAIVHPPKGASLDGRITESLQTMMEDSMYLDPFRSSQEILLGDLRARLSRIGEPYSAHHMYIRDSSLAELVHRMGRNIMASVEAFHGRAMAQNQNTRAQYVLSATAFPDMESASYGALWALMLFGGHPNGGDPVAAVALRTQLRPYILEHVETHFPGDVSLIEQYIAPLFQDSPQARDLYNTTRVMRAGDTMPKQVIRRVNKETGDPVKYKVGQVFQHKRYDYQAVITGWDVECGAGEQWMQQMQVDKLSRGRHQSFYHALVEDRSIRYVAEENIEVVTPEVPRGLMDVAGRYFKRWDRSSSTFVSNIRDEYPDD